METTVAFDSATADEIRHLWLELNDEPELRGNVQLTETPPSAGELGGAVSSITAALGTGGGAAFASVLVAWIRHRTSDLRVTVRAGRNRVVELSCRRVRDLSADEVRA